MQWIFLQVPTAGSENSVAGGNEKPTKRRSRRSLQDIRTDPLVSSLEEKRKGVQESHLLISKGKKHISINRKDMHIDSLTHW
jgi:hypothetical protein